jgi:archaellum biogenesis protein FlaJ (TadC family)
MVEFFKNYGFFISIISLSFFIIGTIGTYYWLLRLPRDYFKHIEKDESVAKKFIRNFLAFVFVVLGILMLFLPGQGLITIFLGIYISDTQLTKKLKDKCLSSRKIQDGLNSIRFKHGKEGFRF